MAGRDSSGSKSDPGRVHDEDGKAEACENTTEEFFLPQPTPIPKREQCSGDDSYGTEDAKSCRSVLTLQNELLDPAWYQFQRVPRTRPGPPATTTERSSGKPQALEGDAVGDIQSQSGDSLCQTLVRTRRCAREPQEQSGKADGVMPKLRENNTQLDAFSRSGNQRLGKFLSDFDKTSLLLNEREDKIRTLEVQGAAIMAHYVKARKRVRERDTNLAKLRRELAQRIDGKQSGQLHAMREARDSVSGGGTRSWAHWDALISQSSTEKAQPVSFQTMGTEVDSLRRELLHERRFLHMLNEALCASGIQVGVESEASNFKPFKYKFLRVRGVKVPMMDDLSAVVTKAFERIAELTGVDTTHAKDSNIKSRDKLDTLSRMGIDVNDRDSITLDQYAKALSALVCLSVRSKEFENASNAATAQSQDLAVRLQSSEHLVVMLSDQLQLANTREECLTRRINICLDEQCEMRRKAQEDEHRVLVLQSNCLGQAHKLEMQQATINDLQYLCSEIEAQKECLAVVVQEYREGLTQRDVENSKLIRENRDLLQQTQTLESRIPIRDAGSMYQKLLVDNHSDGSHTLDDLSETYGSTEVYDWDNHVDDSPFPSPLASRSSRPHLSDGVWIRLRAAQQILSDAEENEDDMSEGDLVEGTDEEIEVVVDMSDELYEHDEYVDIG